MSIELDRPACPFEEYRKHTSNVLCTRHPYLLIRSVERQALKANWFRPASRLWPWKALGNELMLHERLMSLWCSEPAALL